ncbi:hypothetical protein [Carnobacterium maltaromaticum]|uniref:hypothetical protein n=1 Tax=Carnobacterium maltaromaticum TaxID=2751 RepID=UPI00295F0E10|nr:hypothetical protein [Carnobacterium maltaromaticum]
MIIEKIHYCYDVSFTSTNDKKFNKLISIPEKKSAAEIENMLFNKLNNIKKVTQIKEYTEANFLKIK